MFGFHTRVAKRTLQALGGVTVLWIVSSLGGCYGGRCEGSVHECQGRPRQYCSTGTGCEWRVGCRFQSGSSGPPCGLLNEAECLQSPECSWGGEPECFGEAIPRSSLHS